MITTLITVRLRLTSPGAVTAPETVRDDNDLLPIRTDTTGTPHLPGSTVAGSLRHHCATIDALAGAFGGEPGDDTKAASPIQVLGTRHRAHLTPVERTRTAVNRVRGAAENHHLHRSQQLPAGTEFDIVLRWNDPATAQLDALHTALHTWQPRLGRGTSTGAGRCDVVGLAQHTYDLTTPDGLLRWLTDTPCPEPSPITPETRAPHPTAVIDYRLRIVDGLHIGGGTAPRDNGPQLALVHRENDTPVVPGTSLKGALRARAEYICRVLGLPACLDQDCGDCRPCLLFGYTTPDGQSQRSRIAVHNAAITDSVVEQRQHVAIDRFTGGARDTALYQLEVITAGTFQLHIEQLAPLAPGDTDLLHAVLCDLHDGLIGIGARTTSGLGTIRIDDPSWHRPDLHALADTLTNGQP